MLGTVVLVLVCMWNVKRMFLASVRDEWGSIVYAKKVFFVLKCVEFAGIGEALYGMWGWSQLLPPSIDKINHIIQEVMVNPVTSGDVLLVLRVFAWLVFAFLCLHCLYENGNSAGGMDLVNRLVFLFSNDGSGYVFKLLFVLTLVFGTGVQDSSERWNGREMLVKLEKDNDNKKTKKLNITVLTIGTRGDVQPFIAFGQELTSRGHTVCICSFGKYRHLVESNGLKFVHAGVEEIEQENVSWRRAAHVSEVMLFSLPDFIQNYLIVGKAFYEACLSNNTDVIFTVSTTQSFGLSIGEKLKVPVWVVKLAPDNPTRSFPPQGYSNRFALNFLSWMHHWFLVARAANLAGMGKAEDGYRKSVLGIGPLKNGNRLREMGNAPTICAFSGALVKRPTDWPGNLLISGWWFSSQVKQVQEKLPDALDEFLKNDFVVCVTFGSMAPAAIAVDLFDMVIEIILKHFERAKILVISPIKQDKLDKLKNVHQVQEVAHHLVFPRCACVVHHGGAGTLASVIEAAVPSIVVPVLLWTDQPLWGALIEQRRIGVMVSQHFAKIDAREEAQLLVKEQDKFKLAIKSAVEQCVKIEKSYLMQIADLVRKENGVKISADALERFYD